MIRRLIALTFVSAFAASSPTSAPSTGDPTVVKTREGIVQGAIEDGLIVFKSIPYAAPPVGPLRWKPPLPPASWESVRNATEFGSPCPSVDTSRKKTDRDAHE